MTGNNNMIFISHSSKDIQKVRLIRNYLEDHGYDPILLHLGCMDSPDYGDMSEEELLDTALFHLIKEEIQARHLFLYCDSAASKQSRFVLLERKLVEEQKEKAILRIDLQKEEDAIQKTLHRFLDGNSLFLHYSAADREFADILKQAFSSYDDLYLFTPGNHTVRYSRDIHSVIENGMRITREPGGWYIPVLSEAMPDKFTSLIEARIQEKNLRIVPLLRTDAETVLQKIPSFKQCKGFAIDCTGTITPREIAQQILERIHKHEQFKTGSGK